MDSEKFHRCFDLGHFVGLDDGHFYCVNKCCPEWWSHPPYCYYRNYICEKSRSLFQLKQLPLLNFGQLTFDFI